MVKIKTIYLQNFCGYRESFFDFTTDSQVKNLALFYGPNGVGKSTILNAVRFLTSPWRYQSKDVTMLFKKTLFNENYDSSYTEYYKNSFGVMKLDGIFETEDGDKRVLFECDPAKAREIIAEKLDPSEVGVKVNELPQTQIEFSYMIDADNPINMQKFSLINEAKDKFLDIAKAIYGYDCKLDKIVQETDSTGKLYEFYNDFIIYKPESNVSVHFKSMSAGEQKIATMVAALCRPSNLESYDIFLIDNIEMHVYMERHALLIDKIFEHFPNKQILATTHSPILVGCNIPGYITIPSYVDSKYLYNIEDYQGKKNV